ncbi:MAG: hypothetical protein VX768_18685 [Planctomycetota bacterium]|nr:hypothetical protein [Planctomycetota bacterium]
MDPERKRTINGDTFLRSSQRKLPNAGNAGKIGRFWSHGNAKFKKDFENHLFFGFQPIQTHSIWKPLNVVSSQLVQGIGRFNVGDTFNRFPWNAPGFSATVDSKQRGSLYQRRLPTCLGGRI